ncbi:MAG: hypothetical protein ACYC91_20625 [Solirubrobacteraceae bacterium]
MSRPTIELVRTERIIDTADVCEQIETLLPVGVRPRQLQVRTLLVGMLLVAVDGRPMHLRRVHSALLGLAEHDQCRLGVLTRWRESWHRLTYRQTEYTFARIVRALSKPVPDGAPSQLLADVLDRLLEASVQELGVPTSSSYAVDWTDLEAWARPPAKHSTTPSTDPEAGWGHRTSTHPAQNELFYGYHLQAVTTVRDEQGPEIPELVRRVHLASPQHDPPAQIIPVLERMHHDGIRIGDLLADSGYSYRQPQTFALPARALDAQLIIDLHPNDRGPKGTHHGATIANGNLYCPATPTTLLGLGPLPRGANAEQTIVHDQQSAELARYKLAPITRPDTDGYHRASCPAAQNKIRCPHKPGSLTLPHDRPTVLDPPGHPPVCCTQTTITVPPSVNAKTAQKHDYPSPAHRNSYHRRTAAERAFATVKDPATTTIARGACRLTGTTPNALHAATTMIARNIRIADAFTARQTENQRRAACGLPPKTRARRRITTHDLINAHAP